MRISQDKMTKKYNRKKVTFLTKKNKCGGGTTLGASEIFT